jgi:hypothetical protein
MLTEEIVPQKLCVKFQTISILSTRTGNSVERHGEGGAGLYIREKINQGITGGSGGDV